MRKGDKKTKKKKPGNKGRDKGLRFERDFPKELSLWWSEGDSRYIFSSTHGSGTKGNPEVVEEFGDVMSVKECGRKFTDKFRIELKHYKSVDLWKLISNNKSFIVEWWEKYTIDMEKNEDFRDLIIFLKIDYKGKFVIINRETLSWFEFLIGDFEKDKLIFWDELVLFAWPYWKQQITREMFI
jgi:hypothetical protein